MKLDDMCRIVIYVAVGSWISATINGAPNRFTCFLTAAALAATGVSFFRRAPRGDSNG